MALRVGVDFGTSNSGIAISDGQQVRVLPIDRRNVLPEVVKTILYITRDYQHYIGQEAVELYYRHNVNRLRRFVKKWAGEIEYRGAEMHHWMRITSYGIGLHAGEIAKPGTPLSHGCIRLPKDFVAKLYEVTRVGTPVQIVRGG